METFTKKTLILKKPPAAPPVEEPAAAATEESANPPVASVFAAQPVVTAEAPASYTWVAICALVAVLFLAVLVGVQWIEDSYYSTAIPTGTLAAAPAAHAP